MQNDHKKQMVTSLRLQGFSLGAIAKEMNISKSTVSLWCCNISVPKKIMYSLIVSGRKRAIETKRLKSLLQKKLLAKKAKIDVKNLTYRDFFILGIALYWAEGAKPHKHLSLTNMDAILIKAFLYFCQKYFDLSRFDFRYRIQINSEKLGDYKGILQYWCDVLQIYPYCFTKPSIIKTKAVVSHGKKYNGVLRVTAKKSTKNNFIILSLIDRLKILISSTYGDTNARIS